MNKNKNIFELSDELAELAELMNDELGECCSALAALGRRSDYLISASFADKLKQEIKRQLDNIRSNTTVVEREVTFTRQVRELVWHENEDG